MKNSLQKQQGVTLLVAMVILVLVSLIGVIALKNASVEEQMAANLYIKALTFQASESAVESTIDDEILRKQTLTSLTPQTQDVPVQVPDTTAFVSYKYNDLGPPPDGFSFDAFSGARIMITSTGQSTDTNARTRTVHGVLVTVPGQ